MTPDERQRLAEHLSRTTGQRWRIYGDWLPYTEALAIEGAIRVDGVRVNVLRAGDRGYLYTPSPRGWPYHETIDLGRFAGRGWLPALAFAARVALVEYDARPPIVVVTERDRRRVETYRRIVAPDSGASESERAQARQHLQRMGHHP